MNYLEAFLQKKRRAENCEGPTDKTDITGSVSFVSDTPTCSGTAFPQGSVPKIPIFIAFADGETGGQIAQQIGTSSRARPH
jgi:hypothetical protein